MKVKSFPKKAISIVPTFAPSGYFIQVRRDGYVERWNASKGGWTAYATIYTTKTAVLKAASRAIDALLAEGDQS